MVSIGAACKGLGLAAAALLAFASEDVAGQQIAANALRRHGVRFDAAYTAEAARDFSGGAGTGNALLSSLDLRLTVDGTAALERPGLTFFLYGLRTGGENPSTLVGDAQGVSNIAAPRGWRLFEAWVQQDFAAARTSLLAGRLDLNAELYHLDSADLFLNSSYGIGPEFSQAGRGGPSVFPESSLGVRAEHRPGTFLLRAALLNGVPVNVPRHDGSTGLHRGGDGLLYVVEAGIVLPQAPAPLQRTRSRRLRLGRAALAVDRDTSLSVGGWRYTSAGSPSGVYALGEQVLWRDRRSRQRRVRVFGQLGSADDGAATFRRYAGLGLTFVDPFFGRREDELGIALATARRASAPGSESVLELTYLITFGTSFSVQPSLQYIRAPGAEPGLPDARVGLLRFELAL